MIINTTPVKQTVQVEEEKQEETMKDTEFEELYKKCKEHFRSP